MLDQCWGTVMNEIPSLGQRWVNIAKHHTRGQHQANLLVERWADEQDDVGPTVKTDGGPMSESQQSNVGPTSRQPVG